MPRMNKYKTSEIKTNKEGFKSYTGSDRDNALACLMTGSVNTNAFYASKDVQLEMFSAVFDKEARCDPEWFADALVYARNEGYQRAMPIYGLLYLSKYNIKLFNEIFPEIIRNPQDVKNFLDAARSKKVRGLGRNLKENLIEKLAGFSTYDAIKYPSDIRDLIRLTHPSEIVNPDVINYLMKNEATDNRIKALKSLKYADEETKYALIKKYKLPYEAVTSQIGDSKMGWRALYEIAPHFNLIRNLNNFAEYDAITDHAERIVYDRKAKLFPFRYYQAHKAFTNEWKYPEVQKALEKCMDESLKYLPDSIENDTVVALDSSGSMTSAVNGGTLTAFDIGALFGVMIAKAYGTELIQFDSEISNVYRPGNESMLKEIKELHEPCGGTSLSAPIWYMIAHNIECKKFIGFTDNEEWCGQSFQSAWAEYKQRYPEATAVLVTLIPHNDYPTPPSQKDVSYVFGWSDTALMYALNGVKQSDNIPTHKTKKKIVEDESDE